MERQRKQTPGRFLRRNKPYFLLVLALVLLIAAVIFCVKIVRELYTPAQPSVPASAQEPVTPVQPATEPGQQPDSTEQLARLDVQKLNTSRELLKTAELERICIGAVQAYYFTAPATEDFTVTVLENSDAVYDAQLLAPAYNGAPEVTARVRLLQLDGALWCLSAIYPGEDCAALQQTFDSIAVRAEDTP